MTTLRQYEGMDELFMRLEAVRFRQRAITLSSAFLAMATAVLGSIVVLSLAGGYWPGQPPPALRWSLFACACSFWAFTVGWLALEVLRRRKGPAQVARLVEVANPKLRNDLVNAVLLSSDRAQTSQLLVQLAIRETVLRSRRFDFRHAFPIRPIRSWAISAMVAAAGLLVFALLQPGPLKRGLISVFRPGQYVPQANRIRLASLIPGDATFFAGQDVTIAVQIVDREAREMKPAVLIEGAAAPQFMPPANEAGSFALTLPKVDGSFRYAVSVEESRWPAEKPYYTITVLKGVKLEDISIHYLYPPYTGMKARTVSDCDGSIDAPVGSTATISIRLSQAAPRAMLEVIGRPPVEMTASPERKAFAATITVEKDGACRILLNDENGMLIQQLPDGSTVGKATDLNGPAAQSLLQGYYNIHAVADTPPTIEFISPNRDVSVPPGSKLDMKIKAADNYGLSSLRLLAGKEGQPPQPVMDFQVGGKDLAQVDYTFQVTTAYGPGDVIVYCATAADNRNIPSIGGQRETNSARFKIIVADPSTVTSQKANAAEELRDKLMAILKLQETQRVRTEMCRERYNSLTEITSAASQIAAGQQRIRNDLHDLAEKFPFSPEMNSVKQAIALTANNDAQFAADHAQVLASLTRLEDRAQACGLLITSQNKIIHTLQTLLGMLPSLTPTTSPASKPAAGGDLPPEAREKLADLKSRMDEFITSQLKAIRVTADLAKKPIETFSPEDQKLLSDLQAAADKWEKFMSEAFTDLSKLTRQDFSNPLMLQELMSVKSDITMAKDALSMKAMEIATAFEDNGVENAQTLTANLEKWLLDVPDREKWQMEDPINGQASIEQPPLPSQLEDLVGDLLEEEEDLFDQMQDITSKYASSMDKGAGWGAADGPIANMNAQGVTGNQLPNSNEMSGRSGEGRSGKSSGEFVEDKAVGKGGRRTPTRLGNEPFQQGQVNDVSKEPPGGATGGGKVSGSGAEGLEGPVPPPLANEMKRLAGKQAAMVNRAERLREGFKAGDYANFKFLEAITLMNRVQGDLQNNRYQNVLRNRTVTLAAMRDTAAMLSGKLDVSVDASASMPKHIRDDISDAMSGPLPVEYRDVLEQYYRRLGESAGK